MTDLYSLDVRVVMATAVHFQKQAFDFTQTVIMVVTVTTAL
jgi:hypothetical protein